jgi:hypothetical protein
MRSPINSILAYLNISHANVKLLQPFAFDVMGRALCRGTITKDQLAIEPTSLADHQYLQSSFAVVYEFDSLLEISVEI